MRLRCPYCHGTQHWKWTRPSWMFLSPGPMENMRCSECGREYTAWLGVFSQRQKFSKTFCRAWHWFLLVLFFAVIAVVLPLVLW